MPRISKDSAPNVRDAGPAVDRSGDLDDTTVSFVTIRQSHSLAPLLRGLPEDSCQCPTGVPAGREDHRQLRRPRGDLPGR